MVMRVLIRIAGGGSINRRRARRVKRWQMAGFAELGRSVGRHSRAGKWQRNKMDEGLVEARSPFKICESCPFCDRRVVNVGFRWQSVHNRIERLIVCDDERKQKLDYDEVCLSQWLVIFAFPRVEVRREACALNRALANACLGWLN
jgi:hypothetical protein